MNKYFPEGEGLKTPDNTRFTATIDGMLEALKGGKILEGIAAMCTPEHDVIVDLPCGTGIIRREEGALGIAEGITKDIALLSKVGKPICFKIVTIDQNSLQPKFILSRKAAQEECMQSYIGKLVPGDVIPAKVTHLEKFGCFVDIGCGIPSLIPIDLISVSRINHPADRFYNGQNIFVAIKGRDRDRILLSHKELLGSWQQNAENFSVGQTVTGIVRSIEDYGIFIELAPNLAGLAELRENVFPGQTASAFIKAIIPDKMKVKLIIVDAFESSLSRPRLGYYITGGHIDRWVYSVPEAAKRIETVF